MNVKGSKLPILALGTDPGGQGCIAGLTRDLQLFYFRQKIGANRKPNSDMCAFYFDMSLRFNCIGLLENVRAWGNSKSGKGKYNKADNPVNAFSMGANRAWHECSMFSNGIPWTTIEPTKWQTDNNVAGRHGPRGITQDQERSYKMRAYQEAASSLQLKNENGILVPITQDMGAGVLIAYTNWKRIFK